MCPILVIGFAVLRDSKSEIIRELYHRVAHVQDVSSMKPTLHYTPRIMIVLSSRIKFDILNLNHGHFNLPKSAGKEVASVSSTSGGGVIVTLADGSCVAAARGVIVAVDGPAAARLLGTAMGGLPSKAEAGVGTSCVYFSCVFDSLFDPSARANACVQSNRTRFNCFSCVSDSLFHHNLWHEPMRALKSCSF